MRRTTMSPASRPSPRRTTRAPAPFSADTRPLLASDVTFERADDDAAWIVMLHGVPSSRVSRAVVHLLTAMDGEIPLRELHVRFGGSDSFENFVELIERFRASGLLDGDTKPPLGRVVYRPPLTVQLATLHAPSIFGHLDRMTVPLSGRVAVTSLIVVLCLGGVAAAAQASELLHVVSRPVPLLGLVALVVALSLVTLLHESAHGMTLARFGGRPRRAGFMLYYLTPAFFVDVTDGWRLPERRQRVLIALAGPAVHAVIGALALIGALIVPQPAAHQSLLLFALSCLTIVLVNLIPFVRFDGYIALMSALDEPNLRVRTIRDGGDFLARLLFGGQRRAKSLDTWWSVPFGLACLVAPVVLVVFAIVRTARVLSAGGPVLGVLVVALEAAVALVGFVIVARALRRVLRTGVSRPRFVSVCAAIVSGLVLAGAAVTVPVSTTLGFAVRGEHVALVQAGETPTAAIPAGAQVDLLSNGILVNQHVGDGIVARPRAEVTTVPLEALFPVTAQGTSVPGVIVAEIEVSAQSGPVPATGQARVELGAMSLWQMLWTTGVITPLSGFESDD